MKEGCYKLRKSGVLLHLSSLPSSYGIGTLGQEARNFIDFLAEAGQSCWQILPICPTGYGDSPYQSLSSFAGNPYLIDLDQLAEAGLLKQNEYRNVDWGNDPEKVDYGILSEQRLRVLWKAAGRLRTDNCDFGEFCSENEFWLEEYALFMTLKSAYNGLSWQDWPQEYRFAGSEAVELFAGHNADEINKWKVIQFIFFEQWKQLREYAEAKGIEIIGDMPIYVSLDSADVWSHPEMFQLDEDLRPIEISGCPPDGFSETGQLWGNPLFDWEYMKADGYRWWIRRIDYLTGIYHTLRFDHFRGFESYYAIPYGSDDAENGEWRKGPGIELFRVVERTLGRREIIAEDLGFLTEDVKQLLADTGYPGMKVIEMAFDGRDPVGSEYLPHRFGDHCVAYLGTHDNETAIGWLETAPEEDVAAAKSYLHLDDPDNYNWDMMRALWDSAAELTVVQAQDLLGLGKEARMNTPSVPSGNWQWRAKPGVFTDDLAASLLEEMKQFRRVRSD